MPIALTNAQTRFLRGHAHELKAMLQVGGKGITDALVKRADAALVQRIGHTAILYKPSADKRHIVLPRG